MTRLLDNILHIFKISPEDIEQQHLYVLLRTFIILFSFPLIVVLLLNFINSNPNQSIIAQATYLIGLIAITIFSLVAIRLDYFHLSLHSFLIYLLFLAGQSPLPNPDIFLTIISIFSIFTTAILINSLKISFIYGLVIIILFPIYGTLSPTFIWLLVFIIIGIWIFADTYHFTQEKVQMNTLHKIIGRINLAQDGKQILETIYLDHSLGIADHLAIYVFDTLWLAEQPYQFELYAEHYKNNPSSPSTTNTFFLIKDFPLIEKLNATQQWITISKTNPKKIGDKTYQTWLNDSFDSLSLFPLFSENRPIGFFIFQTNHPHQLSKDIVEKLQKITKQIVIAIKSQNLLAQTQEALRVQSEQRIQLETAANVAAAASTLLNVDDLMQTSVSLIQDGFQLYYVGIFLFNDSNKSVDLRAGTGQIGAKQIKENYQVSLTTKVPVITATLTGEVCLVSDVTIDQTWQSMRHLPQTSAELALPLRVRGRTIGALDVHSQQTHMFSRELIQVLQTMSDQLAIAIDNAQLLENTKHVTNQLQLAAEVSRAANTILDSDELLHTIVDLIRQSFDFYYVDIYLIEEQKFIVLKANSSQFNKISTNTISRIPVDNQSLIGKAILARKEIVHQDVWQEPMWQDNSELPDTQAALILPLLLRNQVIGALTAHSTKLNAFSKADVAVLKTLAEQLAVAIENAGLFAHTEKNLQLRTLLYNFGQKITQAQNTTDVYQSLIKFSAQSDLVDTCSVITTLKESPDTLFMYGVWNRKLGYFPPGDPIFEAHFDYGIILPSTNVEIIENGQTESRFNQNNRNLFKEYHLGATILVPIIVEGEWVASLALIKYQSNPPINAQDLQPFQTLCDQAAITLTNQRLLAETEGLYRVSRLLNQAISEEDIIQTAVSAIGKQTGEMQCRFVLYDWSKNQGVLVAEYLPNNLLENLNVPINNDEVFIHFLTTREAIILIDEPHEEVTESIKHHVRQFGAKMSLLVPAFSASELIGYLALDSSQSGRPFGKNIRNFIQAVVDQLTTALENIMLFNDTINRAQELVILNQIGTQLAGTLNLNGIINIAISQIKRLVPYDMLVLALFDSQLTQVNILLKLIDGKKQPSDTRILYQEDTLYQFLYTGTAMVADENTPLVIDESQKTDMTIMPASLWAPLTIEDSPIGYLALQARQSNQYSPNDLQLMITLANQFSLAVTNAKLFQTTQDNLDELRKLLKVSQATASSINAHKRLDNTVRSLHEGLNNANVAIYVTSNETETELELLAEHGEYEFDSVLYLQTEMPIQIQNFNESNFIQQLNIPFKNEKENLPIVVPLMLGKRPIGVIVAFNKKEKVSSEKNFRLLQSLSGSLAATIESGRLFSEIEEANQQLRQMDKLKTQFLANMSHELRTPLNSIIGFSRLILKGIDGPITPEQEEDLTSIHTSGQHLLRLINDILDMSKLEAGKMALVFSKVDLKKVAQVAFNTITPLLETKPVQLILDLPSELPEIEADPIRVRQIFLNLLSNAVKFTEEGNITLKIKEPEDQFVQISVKDTGRGIAEKDFDTLFRAFEQIDASPTREVGGTGLGLPITKSLVNMHGGEIWVRSKVGVGSTFYITFPINQQETNELEYDSNMLLS